MKQTVLALSVFAWSISCSSPPEVLRSVVYIVDESASVPADTRIAALHSLEETSAWLKRGDRVAVIPVTGNVHAETLGRTFRFQLSTRREPYDSDRRRLEKDLTQRVAEFVDSAGRASTSTDLIGTASLAAEELSGPERVLVCLTDFVQDDPQFNFKTDPRLAKEDGAQRLAGELAGASRRFEGVRVYLGSLRSADLAKLSASRRNAIKTFWTEFFSAQGAAVRWATDGPAHVVEFLRDARVAAFSE